MSEKYILRLYVTGQDRDISQMVIKDVTRHLETALTGDYELEIIDVLTNNSRALEDKVFVTPTLVKVSHQPVKRVVGNISDREKVLGALGLETRENSWVVVKLEGIHEEACLHSAESLSRLIGRQAIVDIANNRIGLAGDLLLPIDPAEEIAAIRLPINGLQHGVALLFLVQQTACSLSELLIKKAPGTTNELDELAKSALMEVGNIVCGTYLATLAQHSGIKMIEHAPRFVFDKWGMILAQTLANFSTAPEQVPTIGTEFNFTVPTLGGSSFKTYFLMLFDPAQYEAIVGSLRSQGAGRGNKQKTLCTPEFS